MPKLISGLSAGLIVYESEINDKQIPNQGIKRSVKTALIVGLIVGLTQVIQHICLRFILHQSGVSPWNYDRFLGHAENHRFIQRVGGRYRFVHDLLRKRLAA